MFLYLIPSGRAPIWEVLLPLEAWGGIALKGDTSTRAAHTGIKVRVRNINRSKPGFPNKACQILEVFQHYEGVGRPSSRLSHPEAQSSVADVVKALRSVGSEHMARTKTY